MDISLAIMPLSVYLNCFPFHIELFTLLHFMKDKMTVEMTHEKDILHRGFFDYRDFREKGTLNEGLKDAKMILAKRESRSQHFCFET